MKPNIRKSAIILNSLFTAFLLAVLVVGITPRITDAAQTMGINSPSAPEDDFVITVKTNNTGESLDYQFKIPIFTGETYDYNVDCYDDGTIDTTGETGSYTCDYGLGDEGTYTIRIIDNSGSGTGFPAIRFNNGGDKEKLLSVDQWGIGTWSSMNGAFYGCINMTVQASDAPDLSSLIDLSSMFRDATSFNQDIGSWITSNVTSMGYMFRGATSYNKNINGWDTANVTSMSSMFYGATNYNEYLHSWDTSKVTNMSSMFYDADNFNQDISVWDTSSVSNMGGMFSNTHFFNQDLGAWDTSNVTDMHSMFDFTNAFNADIGDWDTHNVTTMHSMFRSAAVFNQDIGDWDTSNVTTMGHMFNGTDVFDQDIGRWDTSKVEMMHSMFEYTDAFNQDIGDWDTSSVTNMDSMFFESPNFNQDVGGWDTSKVENMGEMFRSSSVFNQDIGGWDTSSVTDMDYLFLYAVDFNQDIGDWDTSGVTDMSFMFYHADTFDQDIGGWDVEALTDATSMFSAAKLSIPNYDALLNGWNAQDLIDDVIFGGGYNTYCTGETARNQMTGIDNWSITDNGKDCSEPEIEVTGLGVHITSGDTTPRTSDGTNFGILFVGGTPITRTFTISNPGYTDLLLTGTPTVTLTDGTHFSVTQQPESTTVISGTAVTFQVTFNPQSIGTHTDTVTIASNDSNESSYTFMISNEEPYQIYIPLILR